MKRVSGLGPFARWAFACGSASLLIVGVMVLQGCAPFALLRAPFAVVSFGAEVEEGPLLRPEDEFDQSTSAPGDR